MTGYIPQILVMNGPGEYMEDVPGSTAYKNEKDAVAIAIKAAKSKHPYFWGIRKIDIK